MYTYIGYFLHVQQKKKLMPNYFLTKFSIFNTILISCKLLQLQKHNQKLPPDHTLFTFTEQIYMKQKFSKLLFYSCYLFSLKFATTIVSILCTTTTAFSLLCTATTVFSLLWTANCQNYCTSKSNLSCFSKKQLPSWFIFVKFKVFFFFIPQ